MSALNSTNIRSDGSLSAVTDCDNNNNKESGLTMCAINSTIIQPNTPGPAVVSENIQEGIMAISPPRGVKRNTHEVSCR